MAEFTVNDMLSNAACASQNASLLEEPVTRGAILRSIRQWLQLAPLVLSIDDAISDLEDHPDFNS